MACRENRTVFPSLRLTNTFSYYNFSSFFFFSIYKVSHNEWHLYVKKTNRKIVECKVNIIFFFLFQEIKFENYYTWTRLFLFSSILKKEHSNLIFSDDENFYILNFCFWICVESYFFPTKSSIIEHAICIHI